MKIITKDFLNQLRRRLKESDLIQMKNGAKRLRRIESEMHSLRLLKISVATKRTLSKRKNLSVRRVPWLSPLQTERP